MGLCRIPSSLGLVLALLAAAPAVRAQSFTADYSLFQPPRMAPGSPAVALGDLRLAPAFPSRLDGSPGAGVGLALAAGPNWFGQVAASRREPAVPGMSPGGALQLGAGYRWGDGEALSLQFHRGRGSSQGLGLAVGYDWPRYFVRFSWDSRVDLSPADRLRLSAGIRF